MVQRAHRSYEEITKLYEISIVVFACAIIRKLMLATKSEALLHFYHRLRTNKVSVIKLRNYSREWNEWKRSDERTLYLLRNERRLVLVSVHCVITCTIMTLELC